MLVKTIQCFILASALVVFTISSSSSEISSDNFSLSVSVIESNGGSKASTDFNVVDTVGQPTPAGVSASADFEMQAGFVAATRFSMPLDETTYDVIGGLEEVLSAPSLNKQ